MNFREELYKLLKLQKFDIELDDLTKKRLTLEEELKEYEILLKEKIERRNELQKIINEKNEIQKQKEEELRKEQEAVRKWEARLKDIKKHREYQALHLEIQEAKRANEKLQEEIIELIGEIDGFKTQISQVEKEISEIEEKIAKTKNTSQGELSNIMNKYASLKKEREEFARTIDRIVLGKYQLIRTRKGNVCIVEAKDGVCLGCYVSLPPQLYNEVLKMKEVIICPRCQRILYYKDEDME
jgi:predicted  nucleic acid-binding Zn-ribbon protein